MLSILIKRVERTITGSMLALHQHFQSCHQAPVTLIEHTVFPQIVLSAVGIAAPWDSWWEESSQLNWTFYVAQQNLYNTPTVVCLAHMCNVLKTHQEFVFEGVVWLNGSPVHTSQWSKCVVGDFFWISFFFSVIFLSWHALVFLCQVEFLQQKRLLNVFHSQLCSPSEETLWGRSVYKAWKHKPQHVK